MSDHTEDTPAIIRTINTYGANISKGAKDWVGTCPFCGKVKKLFVNPEREVWDCKVCGASGNRLSFLQQVYDSIKKDATEQDFEDLSEHRKIPVSYLKNAGFAKLDDFWILPGKTSNDKIHDLRRYNLETKVMASTGGCSSQLLGAEKLARAVSGTRVWICEGEWDSLAMTWILEELKLEDLVVAVPGASVFKKDWVCLFQGMHVIAAYDHDRAGIAGAQRCFKMLKEVASSLKFVCWPASRPDGYDIRDHICGGMETAGAKPTFQSILGLVSHGLPGETKVEGKEGEEIAEDHGEILEPISFEDMMKEFKSKVNMNSEMEKALIVSLAIAFSNDLTGDPLWCYLVGPPGAGKTLLLSAFSQCRRCIFRSTVTPASLVSGWKEGKKDPSLIPQLKGKTFVAKDFTEVLSMPMVSQEEIFSTLRGAYDGSVQKTFGNGILREYLDCHFSMLAGVTNAIHGHRGASLGERFLKFQISKLEGENADSVIMSAIASVGEEKKRELALQSVVNRFLSQRMEGKVPSLENSYAVRLTALVQLVAVLRAQVDRDKYKDDVLYRPIPESGTRLAKQLAKLAVCVAFVLGKSEVDEESYSIVEKVAYDTAYGFNLDILDAMMSLSGEGTRQEICAKSDLPASSVVRRLEDLIALKAIRLEGKKVSDTGRPSSFYVVESTIKSLWHRAKEKPCPISPSPTLPKTNSAKLSLTSKKRLVLNRQRA